MKLVGSSLSPTLPLNERLAAEIEAAAQALSRAAAVLRGQSVAGLAPVVSRRAAADWMTVIELVNEFLLAKARANRSDRYLRQLRVSLKKFAGGRARTGVDQVRTAEIEKWMLAQDWAPKTARGYVSDVRTLFNFGIRRGYLDRNPAAGVELPVLDSHSTIEVHTPDQVRQVLDTARRADLDVCRHLAVRYFAGLRSAEAHRLRESDLKLEQDLIEVPAAKAKTRARRLVTIQPNLKAWLALGGELRAIGDMTIRNVIKLSGVPWPHNAARHSFVSYHVAQFGNAGKTALEAGTSEAMVFKHYRAIVTPAAAAEYWNLNPPSK